jgi:hypothetical protein
VRNGHEAEVADRLGRRHPHLEVFIAEEGDVDLRAGRNAVFRLVEAGDVLAGHLEREVIHELKGCRAIRCWSGSGH